MLSHGLGEQQQHVLQAVIAVAYASLGTTSPGEGHLQCLIGQLGRDVGSHCPTHDPPRAYVHHERQVQPVLATPTWAIPREPNRPS